jgi:hypothetical protein
MGGRGCRSGDQRYGEAVLVRGRRGKGEGVGGVDGVDVVDGLESCLIMRDRGVSGFYVRCAKGFGRKVASE